MKKTTKITGAIGLWMFAFWAVASDDGITLPQTHDAYADTVGKLEQGQTDIDYVAFRDSFVASQAYKDKALKTKQVSDLTKAMFAAASQHNTPEVLRTSKALLSIDYTNIFAHRFLTETYQMNGDVANAKKYHDIEFGLLNSITKNGNGVSCETGYPVVQVSEEYVILAFLQVQPIKQSLIKKDGLACDQLDVKTADGTAKTYYFDIRKTLAAEAALYTPKPMPANGS